MYNVHPKVRTDYDDGRSHWFLPAAPCTVSSAPKSLTSNPQKSLTQQIRELDQINIFKTNIEKLYNACLWRKVRVRQQTVQRE